MALLVQKFGGSSLVSIEHIEQAAQKVCRAKQQGHQVVVVVSAMFSETDRLIALANQVGSSSPRERAALLATGEQVSAALMAMTLQQLGLASVSLNAAQLPLIAHGPYTKGEIVELKIETLTHLLDQDQVPVVTGFQALNQQGELVTLGRGGSDLTAVALAHALQAQECQIFTDVDGVYSCDPHVVNDAKLLAQITYPEMMALSATGAKVMQLQAVRYGQQYAVPIRVLPTQGGSAGTRIVPDDHAAGVTKVSGIAFDRNQGKIMVSGLLQPANFKQQLLMQLRQAAIEVDMMMQSDVAANHEFKYTVHLDDFQQAIAATTEVAGKTEDCAVSSDAAMAKVSVIGLGMSSHAGVTMRMMRILSEHDIVTHLVTSSAYKISLMVEAAAAEQAACLLHDALIR
jgi:aspartate kinase